jgi:putative hydroxymethylpyrimidine transport system permease protein
MMISKLTFLLRLCTIFFIFIACWQGIIIIWHLPDYLLPTPWQVAQALYEQRAVMAKHSAYTLIEILLGFVFGILCGCVTGFAVAFFKPLKLWFLPMMIISQAVPTFAIAPLLVLWLGYGLASKIVTSILMIFFPVASALYDGLRNTPAGWLDLANTLNARQWRLFWMIRIPAALPALASGIRIAAVIAPIGAIIGEWVGASRGLGYLMLNANARLQIDVMFAALIVIVILALLLYFSVDKLLRATITW